MFWTDLERHGDRVALLDATGAATSYATLAALADRSGFGGRARRLALIEMDNSLPAIAAYLGALRAGHAVILTNAGNPESFAGLIDRYRPELVWSRAEGLVTHAEASVGALHPELAVMLSTSGSTGSAKLVRLSAGCIAANAASIVEYLGIGPDERAITTLPPAYSYGLSVINSHLSAGASLVLTDLSVSHPAFAEAARATGATSMAGVPYTYELLDAAGLIDALPPAMKTLTQAGGRLAPDKIERVRQAAERQGARFFVMYGQTEATARMSYIPPERLANLTDCIGQPIPGGRFELRDPDTGAPAETAGELVYHGANVMLGYAESRADLAEGREIEALVTGDLAELAEPGIYRITGRKSRFLKIFGLRVALDEVEREAGRRGWAVVATGDDSRVVLATEDDRDPAALAEALSQHFHLPARCVVALRISPLPRLASGKVDYVSIRAAAPEPEGPPAETGEAALEAYAAFLAKLARKPRVDEDTSFQAIGGDSLNYVEASILLEQAFGAPPPGWEAMTLRDLSGRAATIDPLTIPVVRPRFDTRYIQTLRSIAILLVIGAHSASVVNHLGLPTDTQPGDWRFFSFRNVNVLFLFVAGYLFQYLLNSFDYRSFLRVKAQTVILPYLIVSIPAMLIYLFGHKDPSQLAAPPWVDTKPELFVYMLLTGTHLGPLWFVPMIAIMYFVSPLLKAVDSRPVVYWAIVPLLALSYFVGRPLQDNDPIRAFVFLLPVYLTGMACCRHRERLLPILARFWPILMLAVFAPMFLVYGTRPFEWVALVSKLLFTLGVLGAAWRFADRVPARFAELGELSFGLYFVHGYAAAAVLAASRHVRLHLPDIAGFWIVFLFILLSSLLGVMIVKRLFGGRSRFIVGA